MVASSMWVGSPAAVAQPNGVVDVFWKGAYDDHLWHAQYSPDRGWRGPGPSRPGAGPGWPGPRPAP